MKINVTIQFELPDEVKEISGDMVREAFRLKILESAKVYHARALIEGKLEQSKVKAKKDIRHWQNMIDEHQIWFDRIFKSTITKCEVIKPAKKVDNG